MTKKVQEKQILPKVEEFTVFELSPADIIIKDELPRQRKDLGEIAKLVASIQEYGQLQPIVINRKKELIAGGRRLAACILGGFNAKVCYVDTVDPLRMQEMELEENVQRKDLTPAEESLAVSRLVELKRQIYGTPVQGRVGGYTLDDAASLLGKTKGYVAEQISIADAVTMFPTLLGCKTKSEIKSAVKGMQRVSDNMEALTKYEDTIKQAKEFVIVNRDATIHMKGIPDASIDLLFTDPPYGINIDKTAMTVGGHTGGDLTTTGFKYEDSPEIALPLYQLLATESVRFCRSNAHALIFCGPSHFWTIKNMFNAAGWICSERPVIWIKHAGGQNNNPDAWFSSSYEILLFARKTESRLIVQGKPDWIQCNIVLPSERIHQAEKPIPLLKELISRVCLPGNTLYDPFTGSGAIMQAAIEMKVLVIGCELSVEAYAGAVSRLSKLIGEKK
jgi:DNA modification methylase